MHMRIFAYKKFSQTMNYLYKEHLHVRVQARMHVGGGWYRLRKTSHTHTKITFIYLQSNPSN